MTTPSAKYKDGKPYSGIGQYLGVGIQRSCGKCGNFQQLKTMKKLGPWGLCCEGCRGVKS